MRTNHQHRKNQHLLLEDEVIADKKQKNIEQCIAPTTGSVPECGFIHKTHENRIEKIQYPLNCISQSSKFKK